jgi:hypothetical protein
MASGPFCCQRSDIRRINPSAAAFATASVRDEVASRRNDSLK